MIPPPPNSPLSSTSGKRYVYTRRSLVARSPPKKGGQIEACGQNCRKRDRKRELEGERERKRERENGETKIEATDRRASTRGCTTTGRQWRQRRRSAYRRYVRTREKTHIAFSSFWQRRTRKRNVSRSAEFSGSSVCLANDVNNASE